MSAISHQSCCDRKAFTLIELLVVIAIIVLLVSILVPSLKEAKALAIRAVCLSTMRSNTNAAGIYSTENGRYAPAGYYIPSNASTGYTRLGPWFHKEVMGAYMGLGHITSQYPEPEGPVLCPAAPVDAETSWVAYNNAMCSTAHGDLRIKEGLDPNEKELDSLGYRRSIPYAVGPTIQDVTSSPEKIVLFLDGREEGFIYVSRYKSYDKSNDSFDPVEGLNAFSLPYAPDNRHSGGVNYGFMDGHAAYFEDAADALRLGMIIRFHK